MIQQSSKGLFVDNIFLIIEKHIYTMTNIILWSTPPEYPENVT